MREDNKKLNSNIEEYTQTVYNRMTIASSIYLAMIGVAFGVGCANEYQQKTTYVIKDISTKRILVKNSIGQQKTLVLDDDMWELLQYSCVGDRIHIYEKTKLKKHKNNVLKIDNSYENHVKVNKQLLKQRQKKAKFDSLQCVIARENRGKQR